MALILSERSPIPGTLPSPHPLPLQLSAFDQEAFGSFLQSSSPVLPLTRAKSLSPRSILPWTQESRPPAPPPPDPGVWAPSRLYFQERSGLSSFGPVNSSPLTSLQPARGKEPRDEDAWDQLLRADNSSDGVAWPSGSPTLLNQQEHLCQDSFLSPVHVKAPAWEGQGLLAGKEEPGIRPWGRGWGPWHPAL